jgi:hypothetical protein
MMVLLEVLFKINSKEPSIHAGCSLICGSGPGTTNKAEKVQSLPAFFFCLNPFSRPSTLRQMETTVAQG